MVALRALDGYRLYLIFSGATSFLFALAYTVVAVYRVERAGLGPLQLVLVGTVLEVTYFLFNVPTGVVADTYGRRLSVIVGVFLSGVGLVVEGFFPLFAAILLAQAIGGIGYTFVEGALEAWLSDEVGEEQLGAALLRGGQIGRAAGFLGIAASVGLASVRLNLPVVLAGGSSSASGRTWRGRFARQDSAPHRGTRQRGGEVGSAARSGRWRRPPGSVPPRSGAGRWR